MTKFHVFVGAPSISRSSCDKELHSGEHSRGRNWQIVSSEQSSPPDLVIFPPLVSVEEEETSRRISLLYANAIFDNSNEENDLERSERWDRDDDDDNGGGQNILEEDNTSITWPPTAASISIPSGSNHHGTLNLPTKPASISSAQLTYTSQFETQQTESYNYSDAASSSSIAQFPDFQFNPHSITSLSSLQTHGARASKVSLLVAILEVDGPDSIRIKRGVDAGKDAAILKLIIGDEDGALCKLTAWREIAEAWGGGARASAAAETTSPAIRRGDVVLLENILASSSSSSEAGAGAGAGAGTVPTATASPYLKSKLQICYRTMPGPFPFPFPFSAEPNNNNNNNNNNNYRRLRPDLRLGVSDVAVRKVAAVVRWFEGMAGLGAKC